MASEEPPQDPLRQLLEGLSEALRNVHDSVARRHEMEETSQAAHDYAQARGGMVIPMGINAEGVPEHVRGLVHGLMTETSRASIFLGQLPAEHPYRAVFAALGEAWENAAVVGALTIAKHNAEHHRGGLDVGPEEFGEAWRMITTTAVLGAIRFGQEHPEAFKGTEGLKDGEIDDTVTRLIAWAVAEHGKGDQPE